VGAGGGFFAGQVFPEVLLPEGLELVNGRGWELAHAKALMLNASQHGLFL
jgi:hypothetical protein